MCGGASSAQQNISQEQQEQYTQLMQSYTQLYGEDQGILTNLTSALQPIINAGPSQQGYSQDELNSLDTQATEGTAQGYAQAQQAMQENQAAMGGGSTYVPSGGQQEVRGQLAATAANALSAQKTSILSADYQQGNQNYENAVSQDEGVAGLLNPTGAASASTSSGSAAASEANTITQQNNSIWTTVLGGLSGVAGSAAGGWAQGGFKT